MENLELLDKKQKLENDVSHLETVRNETLLILESLKHRIELAQIELDEKISKKDETVDEANKTQVMIKQLQGYISEHQEVAQKALKLRADAQKEVDDLKAQKEALEAEIEAKKASASGEIKAVVISLEKEVSKLENDKKSLSNEISKTSSDLSIMKSSLSKVKAEISSLQSDYVNAGSEYKDIQDKLRVIRIEYTTKLSEIASFDSRKEIAVSETTKEEEKLKNIKAEIVKFTQDRDKVLSELEAKQGEIISINTAKLQIAEEKRNLAMRTDNLKRLFEEAGLPWTD